MRARKHYRDMHEQESTKAGTRRYEGEARRLQSVRRIRGMTQVEFAAWLDYPYKSYHANETGNRQVALDLAKRIRDKTGFTLDWLYTGDESMLRADLSAELASFQASGT
jgi:DNA-binding XRE family transcriptional regulator